MATRTKTPRGSATTVPEPESFYEDVIPEPYAIAFTIEGTRGYIFNRYDVPANPDPGLKGQTIVQTPEQRVTLDSDGNLAARTSQVWNAVVAAGKFRKNPRSAKGSLSAVLKDALEIDGLDEAQPDLLTFEHPSGKPYTSWEFTDERRTKKAGAFAGYVTKLRPGIQSGWLLSGRATILLPQYVNPQQLHECFEMAGRFGGIGDMRNGGLGFGRFLVRRFEPTEV